MRCAIYARVSTDRQRERHTIDSQLRLLPEYAKREGWEVVHLYKDDGRSGETVEARPEFTQLLEDAAKKQFDAVLVIDLDRITRSRKSAEGAVIFDHFRENGIKLATPTQGLIDLDDEDQDLLVGIKRELSKWEKRKILSRMMRGKREAAKKGKRFACLDPYGLRWVKDEGDPRGGAYLAVQEEAEVVRRIYDLAVIEGLGKTMIAWRLNSEGYRTRDIRRGSRPNGGPGEWAASTVGKILRSRTYRGEFVVFQKDEKTIIPVPAIINEETWNRAQASLKVRKPERRWKHNRQYLLSGLARCGVCGHGMWVVNARPHRHGQHAYYRCTTSNSWRKMKLDGPCGNRHHRVDLTDASVWEKLVEVLRDPELLAQACALSEEPAGVDWASQAEGTRRKLAELEKHEGEILKRHRRGLVSAPAFDTELGEVDRERKLAERNLKLAEEQLADAGSRQRLVRDIEAQAAALAARVGESTFEERRALVRLLVPTEHGSFIKLHRDGSMEVQAILPTETAAVEMNLVVSKSG
jgi:site-specific DNA recombinase